MDSSSDGARDLPAQLSQLLQRVRSDNPPQPEEIHVALAVAEAQANPELARLTIALAIEGAGEFDDLRQALVIKCLDQHLDTPPLACDRRYVDAWFNTFMSTAWTVIESDAPSTGFKARFATHLLIKAGDRHSGIVTAFVLDTFSRDEFQGQLEIEAEFLTKTLPNKASNVALVNLASLICDPETPNDPRIVKVRENFARTPIIGQIQVPKSVTAELCAKNLTRCEDDRSVVGARLLIDSSTDAVEEQQIRLQLLKHSNAKVIKHAAAGFLATDEAWDALRRIAPVEKAGAEFLTQIILDLNRPAEKGQLPLAVRMLIKEIGTCQVMDSTQKVEALLPLATARGANNLYAIRSLAITTLSELAGRDAVGALAVSKISLAEVVRSFRPNGLGLGLSLLRTRAAASREFATYTPK